MEPKQRDGAMDVEARIRANAGSAGLVAGLLIFFGFFWFKGATGAGVFWCGDTLFHCTLRLGGIAMAVIAVWSSVGVPTALMVDAITSAAIGFCLALSAVLLCIGGGLTIDLAIYLVCGASFMSSGVRGWREYRAIILGIEVSEKDALEALSVEAQERFDDSTQANGETPHQARDSRGQRGRDPSPPHPADDRLTRIAKRNRSPRT